MFWYNFWTTMEAISQAMEGHRRRSCTFIGCRQLLFHTSSGMEKVAWRFKFLEDGKGSFFSNGWKKWEGGCWMFAEKPNFAHHREERAGCLSTESSTRTSCALKCTVYPANKGVRKLLFVKESATDFTDWHGLKPLLSIP